MRSRTTDPAVDPTTSPRPVRRPGPSRDRCPTCGQDRVTVVGMDLGGDSSVELHACGHCETKTWVRDGKHVEMAEVLAKIKETGGPKHSHRPRNLP